MMNIIELLPEECLSQIMSFTTPKDVVRSSVVSKQFLSASESDILWDKFLPSDCNDILSRSSSPFPRHLFASKKDLFLRLAHFPLLLDGSTKSLSLDKRSGKICYTLGARMLSIIWGDTPENSTWEPVPESRFPECAVLQLVSWLDISGRIHATSLSPNTTYGAYFVFTIRPGPFHLVLGDEPVKVRVLEDYEDGLPRENYHATETRFYLTAQPSGQRDSARMRQQFPGLIPVARGDGWMEVEMGRCQVGGDGERVALFMTFVNTETQYWKSGLVDH